MTKFYGRCDYCGTKTTQVMLRDFKHKLWCGECEKNGGK